TTLIAVPFVDAPDTCCAPPASFAVSPATPFPPSGGSQQASLPGARVAARGSTSSCECGAEGIFGGPNGCVREGTPEVGEGREPLVQSALFEASPNVRVR